MSNPFDFVNAINSKQEPDAEIKDYNPWITNRAFSYHVDTIYYANEMNKYSHLGNQEQFDFYMKGVSKRKRFTKWGKVVTHDIEETAERVYQYNKTRINEMVAVLTDEQILEFKEYYTEKSS